MSETDSCNDWKWQIANRISTREQLEEVIELTAEERAAFEGDVPLSFAVTPHYAGLLQSDALRRTVIPTNHENALGTGELADPLGEEGHRATPHLIHTYPDKVLFLVTTFCSTYCRYCTRSRIVGKGPADFHALEESFLYIEKHSEIRDVLLSGGDPLTLTDSVLDDILSRLRSIPHVRMIRIGSKVPVVLPMRITDELCSVFRKHRVWLSLHFIHADELSPETQGACQKLSNHGIGMVSQTVLLKGVNDDTEALIDLFYGLLEINVKPYYLLQCDPVRGSAHFRTPVAKGIELIQSLHGRISGLAVPQYVIDAPGGGGKVPILGVEQIRREGDDIVFTNYEGIEYRYPDPEEK
ncbi:KamA family radical SAM protein [Pontiella sulfatireligans]|uniref:L-lysine 2,3-aminomutase n=1 Tax=Pontiella sulfatireligans TaxID=2750658 RepID=A0A6C2UCT7_9BACT|nr:KamA family radical SAM protein [Pontiella sulfatireligans]VGO17960.1 L-lysine 2,3-aminomutase [Pontiella sulfatireligans]